MQNSINAQGPLTHQPFFSCYSAALVIQIYVQLDRIDLARKEAANVKSWAEDALLAQLLEAWVDLRVVGARTPLEDLHVRFS